MIIWKLKYIIWFSVIFLHLVVFICWQVARQIESLSGKEGDSKLCQLIISLFFFYLRMERVNIQWLTDNRGITPGILSRYYHWILGNSIIISLLMSVVYIYFLLRIFSISLIMYFYICVKHVNLLNYCVKHVS